MSHGQDAPNEGTFVPQIIKWFFTTYIFASLTAGCCSSTVFAARAVSYKDDWATLAVDGHVKVYAGRNGRLPKHFVARQKLCLPASVSYWINALGGTPLLCLHQALEQDVAPHLLQLGVVPEAAPDLAGGGLPPA